MNQTRCWSLLKLKSDVWSCQVMPNSSAIAKTYRRGTQLDEVLRKFLRGRSKEYSTEKESSWAFHNQHCQESFLSGSLAACCNSKPHGHILPQFCVLTKVLRGYPRTEAPTPERHSRSSGLRVVSPWGILISSDIHRFWTHRKPKGRAYSGPTLESDISMFTSAVTHLTSRSPPQVGNIPFRFFLLLCLFDLVWRFANAKPEVKPCLFIRYHLENLHGQFRSCGYSFHLCMVRLLLFQECLIYDAHGKHCLSFFGASAQLRADHCGTRIFFWNCCGETDGEISANSGKPPDIFLRPCWGCSHVCECLEEPFRSDDGETLWGASEDVGKLETSKCSNGNIKNGSNPIVVITNH